MPKQRQTCTRCSMRRQKCDRKSPCTRCVQNNEAHLCTTEWSNGYNPAVHRRYPRKSSPRHTRSSTGGASDASASSQTGVRSSWPSGTLRSGHSTRDISYPGVSSSSTEDSAIGQPGTNVDFIHFRRSAYTDITVGGLLREGDGYDHDQDLMDDTMNQNSTTPGHEDTSINSFSPSAQRAEVQYLQAILPPKELVLQMTDYHNRCMSYWVGGVYHGPSFRKSIHEAYGESQELDLRKQDWRWSALLFSILSASMIASDEAVSTSWGYSHDEKLRLSREWGHGMMSCLNLGDYASDHHVYSVQAILNLHTSAHLVGSAKEWTTYQAAATVIARGLGFHKLSHHADDSIPISTMTQEQKEDFLDREIGRRLWSALTAQDWLCSTSQGIYYLQKRHYTSVLPRNIDEDTLLPIPNDNTPCYTLISNYLNEVAYMLSRYLDDMLDAPDLAAKYNVVLRYDGVARAITTEKMPKFLRSDTPYNASWPQWTLWARRSYNASAAHKIIMVHQSFLGKSFKDPRYTYSRWACLSSSKTIIETMEKRYPEEPQWWVEQAYIVTAGLCIGLNLFHHSSSSKSSSNPTTTPSTEAKDDIAWLEKCIKILEHWPTSSVATHGIKLLTSLMQEHEKKLANGTATAGTRHANGNGIGGRGRGHGNGVVDDDDDDDEDTEKEPEFPSNIAPQAIAEASSAERPQASSTTTTPRASTTSSAPTTIQTRTRTQTQAQQPLPQTTNMHLPTTLPMDHHPSISLPVSVPEDPWMTGGVGTDFDVDMMAFDNLIENLPLDEGGLDNSIFLESMLGWNSAGFSL